MISAIQFATGDELQEALGDRIRRLRLARNVDQRETADKAGISLSALRNLEAGRGATTGTLLRTLKALDSLEGLEMLVPEAKVNPVELLRTRKPQLRVHRSRTSPRTPKQ